MDKTARTLEVTFEKSETTIVRRGRKMFFGWCSGCLRQVRMLSPEEAAHVAGISPRHMYQRIEAESVHFIETADANIWVCAECLAEERI
jgi:hypothetical protein